MAAGRPGQNMVEYALLVAFIAALVLLGIGAFGGEIHDWFAQLITHIVTTGTANAASASA
jgi:Flp pilus assembly pilin Flp